MRSGIAATELAIPVEREEELLGGNFDGTT
jgi:hypothetical protein